MHGYLHNAVTFNHNLKKVVFTRVTLNTAIQQNQNLAQDPTRYQHVTHLELDSCSISCRILRRLSQMLPSLQKIDLKSCRYDDDSKELDSQGLDNEEEEEPAYEEEESASYQEFGNERRRVCISRIW